MKVSTLLFPTGATSVEVKELEIDMISIALDHEKLQVSTKQYMENVRSSKI